MARIASSPQFRRAAKLRDFLTYVVEQTLQSRSDALNEYQIGRVVFGRSEDYSPSEDNVVRAHARQLRVKLSEYFATAGKNEPLVVEIPKGTYVPVFSQRPSVAGAPVEHPPDSRRPARLSPRILLWGVIGVVAALLATSVFLVVQNRSLQRQLVTALGASPLAVPAPLAWVLDPDRSVSLVVADSCFGLMQDLAGRPASLEEYLTPQFWQTAKPSPLGSATDERLMRRIRSRELTSYADVLLAARILRLTGPRAKMAIRFARDVRPRELNSGNYIFLGSAYANPWVALYDRKRNFRIQVDADSKQSIANKKPRPGEQASYLMLGEDGQPGATYGLISFLPSDSATGNVLLIEGTNMEGTEAAGNLILDPKSAHDILSQAGIPESSRSHPFFEILIETKVLAGEPSQTRVVAWRK
ncbi:MAG: hypothetical protein P4K98_06945 [Bryobacteraceae bacterium]|nr:hypothetical protein [Bryobacteraceae bacterium]